jgi:hypothetical protein
MNVETLPARDLRAAVSTLPDCQPSAGVRAMDRAVKPDRAANPRSVGQPALNFALTLFHGRFPLQITMTSKTAPFNSEHWCRLKLR